MQSGSTDPNLLSEVPFFPGGIISIGQQGVATNDAALVVMTASDFERPVHFYGMHISLGQALWYELFDDIHHPGQISVYIRLTAAKRPSIYGPTADEPFAVSA